MVHGGVGRGVERVKPVAAQRRHQNGPGSPSEGRESKSVWWTPPDGQVRGPENRVGRWQSGSCRVRRIHARFVFRLEWPSHGSQRWFPPEIDQRPVIRLRRFGCRLKLYPTRAQAERFARWAQSGSRLRDLLLERDEASYRETGKRLSRRALQDVVYEFASAHPGLGWPAHARNQHRRDHAVAVRGAFARLDAGKRGRESGWPVLRRGRPTSIYVHNQMLRVSGSYVRLSRAPHGWTRYRGTIPDGKIMSGRIRRHGGTWTLSLSIEAPMPAYVEPQRETCHVRLGPGGVAEVTDVASGTTVCTDLDRCRELERRMAKLRRRAGRRSWRCADCGGLMRADARSGLLARDKRKAPCGHWIEGYERTARLRRAEAALAKTGRRIRNRQRDAVHHQTAGIVRRYGKITVYAEPGHGGGAVEFTRQLDYKSAWHRRALTTNGTAARAETGPSEEGQTDVETCVVRETSIPPRTHRRGHQSESFSSRQRV